MAYVEVFKDKNKMVKSWRWRRKAANHEITASSGEAFTRKTSAARAAHKNFPEDEVKVIG